MGFLSGRVSYERFAVQGEARRGFDESILERAAAHRVGERAPEPDLSEIGFIAGQHALDLDFQYGKNVIDDALHLGLRIDTNKPPAALKRAYMEIELRAAAADNPSGKPTKQQKAEAKEAVEQRLEEEAKTGKFRKMRSAPFLWDARGETVFFGGSASMGEKLIAPFREAFDAELARMTATDVADKIAKRHGLVTGLANALPSAFHADAAALDYGWIDADRGPYDFLGNEFLMWLWRRLDDETDVVNLPGGGEAVVMFTRTLSLECPLGDGGKETISALNPTKLSEARQAIRTGKLPRKAGLHVSRDGEDYQFTLQAESLAVSGAALPKLEDDGAGDVERIELVRRLSDTVDQMFEAFCLERFSTKWDDHLGAIRDWVRAGGVESSLVGV